MTKLIGSDSNRRKFNMEIPEEEFLAPGHRGCAGCGATIGVRLALKMLGKNTVAVSATGCLEVITSQYPPELKEPSKHRGKKM
jgi:pyruvate/2-oxoacid:ferredoxin oxidoreductase beta subunit